MKCNLFITKAGRDQGFRKRIACDAIILTKEVAYYSN